MSYFCGELNTSAMIKRLFSIVLLSVMLFTGSVIAQPIVGAVTKKLPKVNVGLKVGANFESLTGNAWQNTYKGGVVFGAFARVYKGNLGLDVEAMINTAQYSPVDSFASGTFRALYLNVPVLIEYKLFHRLWLQVGPQFSPLISMSNSAVDDPKALFKSSYLSGVAGLQVILPMHIVAGVRYVLGFTDINNISSNVSSGIGSDAWKNRSIQLHVGFRFL